MGWKTLDDMDVSGKRVLVRVDINVPVEGGKVTDATRITRIVPTVQDILAKGGTPVLLAHFGRPKGKVNPDMSLGQVLPALRDALGREVTFVEALEDVPRHKVTLCLSRTSAFTPAKRQMTLNLPNVWRHWAIFTATTPFPPHTVRMHQPKAWHSICRLARAV